MNVLPVSHDPALSMHSFSFFCQNLIRIQVLPTHTSGLIMTPPLLLCFALTLSSAVFAASPPWQRWVSPLKRMVISHHPASNLTTLYPRLDKIVGRSIHMYGHYSPAELQLLARPEFLHTMVVEVGAHIGALSAAMSQSVGDSGVVISVEPNPFFADIAAANIALNSKARSVVLLSAASNVSLMQCLRSAALDSWQVSELHELTRPLAPICPPHRLPISRPTASAAFSPPETLSPEAARMMLILRVPCNLAVLGGAV